MRSRENPNNQRNKRQRKKAAAPAIPTKTKDKKYSVVVNFSENEYLQLRSDWKASGLPTLGVFVRFKVYGLYHPAASRQAVCRPEARLKVMSD
jgi:hypothetical protein